MKAGTRVLLQAFNGSKDAPDNTEAHENYWLLIGKIGTVEDDNQAGQFRSLDGFYRVLVSFDDDLEDLGLENHNSVKNSLWMRVDDLILAN